MCGRFSIADLKISELQKIFDLKHITPFDHPSYNVAPTLWIPAIRAHDKELYLDTLRWGLIPPWAKDKSIGNRMINARMETLAEKPSFKKAFKSQRCIIPATGFFEWKKQEDKKQPFFIHRVDDKPITFAGLWEYWVDKETGEVIDSCTIITTKASSLLEKIHDRMPVIFEYEKAKQWLDPEIKGVNELNDILDGPGGVELDMYPVSDYVNSVKNDGEKCVERV
jgi:putative SOS response-associated peptidase YedK